jgi:hypothetical protein
MKRQFFETKSEFLMPVHRCMACGEEFEMRVWHCSVCAHHESMVREDCWNCHRGVRSRGIYTKLIKGGMKKYGKRKTDEH